MPVPQSLLFQAEHFPHYVNFRTQRKVLRVYRELHRALSKLKDSLAAPYLKQRAQHGFAAYKYVTDTSRIEALLKQTIDREIGWAKGAAIRRPKQLQKTLDLAFKNYGVKESSLKRILDNPPLICDHESLVYKLNNAQVPSARTFDEHATLKQQSMDSRFNGLSDPFWMLMRILRSHNIRNGANGRKLVFDPEDSNTSILTVFGDAVAQTRQGNILRSMYSTFLRDAPRPVHPEVLEHLKEMVTSPEAARVYRRRFRQCAKEFWSVDHEGRIVGLRSGHILAIPDLLSEDFS